MNVESAFGDSLRRISVRRRISDAKQRRKLVPAIRGTDRDRALFQDDSTPWRYVCKGSTGRDANNTSRSPRAFSGEPTVPASRMRLRIAAYRPETRWCGTALSKNSRCRQERIESLTSPAVLSTLVLGDVGPRRTFNLPRKRHLAIGDHHVRPAQRSRSAKDTRL